MANTIALKRRITSIKGTRQITKAMELVSASKLRRAQKYAALSREYGDMAYDLLIRLNAINELDQIPLFKNRPVKSRLYVIVTSNTGLAGAYNANTLKKLTENLKRDKSDNVKSHVIAIGNKGAQFVRRLHDVDLVAVYPPFSDQPTANDVRPILSSVLDHFKEEYVDEVGIIYTKFHSTVKQESTLKQLLPAPLVEDTSKYPLVSNFEPDVETVVNQVATRLIEAQMWQAVLESLASEHAMRMLATKNATDNANELIDDYTLELNSARQADITQQIAEISGGAEAMAT